jgi:negative regulator of replication initiation
VATVQVDLDVYNYLVNEGMGGSETASSILRRALLHTIEIDDDLLSYLMSLAASPGESIANILRRELHLQDNAPNQPPARIEFHIPAGTGAGPWNAADRSVAGVVGQILRLFNDDSIAHRPHTDGAPFPHPASDIAPGSFTDFPLQSAYDPATDPPIYDHDQGPGARFWITVHAAP